MSEQKPIRVIDLPGFDDIEAKLRLSVSPRAKLPPRVEEAIDELSRRTFGITSKDTQFPWPEGGSLDDEHLVAGKNEHERQFETGDLTDDDAVEFLKGLGFDFNDQRGMPLRCVAHFARQAEAVGKGIMGMRPERAVAGLEKWADSLEKDARAFKAGKRRP